MGGAQAFREKRCALRLLSLKKKLLHSPLCPARTRKGVVSLREKKKAVNAAAQKPAVEKVTASGDQGMLEGKPRRSRARLRKNALPFLTAEKGVCARVDLKDSHL